MASKNIKGLTIEIGGDTTELGKALEDVNKKGRDLSSELGEINKLLKLDPGNADLIAQKQQVLAEAIENTAAELETLKEAEKQVQEQFERGEVSEEQVRALQREIIKTEQKMEGYKKAAEETAGAVEKLGEETDDTENELKETKKGTDKAADSLDDMAESAEKADKASGNLGETVGNIVKGGLQVLTGLVTAAGAALVSSAEASREYRTAMGKLDASFHANNLSAETATKTYKALQSVIGDTDQTVEAAQQISLMAESEQDAARWAKLAAGVVGQFGDALQPETFFEAANETLKLGEATGAFTQMLEGTGADVELFNSNLATCSDEAERQAYILAFAEQQLGEAGKRYRETNAEIIRNNQANEEWAASVAEVGGAVEPLLTDVKLLGASLIKDLVPGVKDVTGAFRNMLNGDEGAGADLGAALSGIISSLLEKVTNLLPQVAEMGVSLITSLSNSVTLALPLVLDTAVQIITTLLNGLTTALPQMMTVGQTVIPALVQSLVNGIPLLINGAVQLFLAVVRAVPQIIPPLVAAIPKIVNALVEGLASAIPVLIRGAVNFLDAIVQAIPLICETLAPEVPKIITLICDTLIDNIDLLFNGALTLLDAIVQAVPAICKALLPEVPRIVNTLTSKLIQMVPTLLSAAITLFYALIDAIPVMLSALLPEIPGIIDSVISALISMTPVLLEAAVTLFMALVNAVPKIVSSLTKELVKLGKDIVAGLWKGISDKAAWLKDKISGWVGDVTGFLKKLFGINSPSKVTAWMGEMIDEGFAKGIEDNTKAPLNAMSDLTDAMLDETGSLDGLAIERQIQHSFTAPTTVAGAEAGIARKLDQILEAIKSGQVLTINGDTLVGATANAMNNALGQRRILAERGAA